jgi:formamidase
MKSITINRSLRLVEEPGTGHNRWHPDIEPLIAADEGEEVVLETRDASDGKIVYGGSASAVGPNKAVHPLTGPVWVNGAAPGDLVVVEYLEIRPESWGFSRFS